MREEKREAEPKTEFEEKVRGYALKFGGFFNAHCHGDRAFTREDRFYEHVDLSVEDIERLSLRGKQNLVWVVHTGSAFDKECIEERFRRLMEDSLRYGVSKLSTTVDVTYNTKLKSLEIAEKLKKEYTGRLELRIGAYNVAGFKDSSPERFEIFEEAARRADFLVALAEKDRKPEHIGEHQHNVYILNLGLELGKPVHFHVGQANTILDRTADLLFEDVGWVYDVQHRLQNYPKNMMVHDISSACYSEKDFKAHCEDVLKYNFGLICCPSAALSMRQDRTQDSPLHNSIARVWDMATKGVPIFLGTDNVNDMFVPSSTPDLFDEIFLLAPALRFNNPRILAKVACGEELDDFDKERIENVLFK